MGYIEERIKLENQHNNFVEDLEAAINFLAANSNLQLLEKMTENFISTSQSGKNLNAYVIYQVQVYELLGTHAGVVINYLKSEGDLPYNGRNKEAFRRLTNLRTLSKVFYTSAEKAFAQPNSLSTTLFTYNDINPHFITMMLINNDQTAFTSNLDFNDTLNLINQLLINLEQKLHKGANNIEAPLIDQFKEVNFNFLANIDNIMNKESKE